uniref:Uncharacterized protein n=1 Tax=Cacopsylla melanoneura TaxID=428564 RepID=A0A8D8U137_9HEMI
MFTYNIIMRNVFYSFLCIKIFHRSVVRVRQVFPSTFCIVKKEKSFRTHMGLFFFSKTDTHNQPHGFCHWWVSWNFLDFFLSLVLSSIYISVLFFARAFLFL